MKRLLIAAVLLCLAATSAPPASAVDHGRGRVRPTPTPSADDSFHTRATADWLGPRSRRRPAGSVLPPCFEDVSVHDPAIVEADGQYYIFGSHLA